MTEECLKTESEFFTSLEAEITAVTPPFSHARAFIPASPFILKYRKGKHSNVEAGIFKMPRANEPVSSVISFAANYGDSLLFEAAASFSLRPH